MPTPRFKKLHLTALLLTALLPACAEECPCKNNKPIANSWEVNRPNISPPRTGPVFDVTTYAAKSDGTTVNTVALQKTLNACAANGGGIVLFPPGIYLTGSLVIGSNTTLRLDKGATIAGTGKPEDYPVVQNRWEGQPAPVHRALLSSDGARNIAIVGAGTIIGSSAVAPNRPSLTANGRIAFQPQGTGSRGPAVVELVNSSGIRIEGITLKQTGIWTSHLTSCEDVLFRNVTIDAAGPNSDGIVVDSTQRVWIDRCSFSNEDDAIALKSGKGNEGRRLRPAADVLVTDCAFHKNRNAGISLGSECSGGIRRVDIERCTFENAMAYTLRLKTAEGRGGFIEGVRMRDITSSSARFLQVMMNVNNPDPEPLPNPDGITAIKDIDIEGVKLGGGQFVEVIGRAEKPLEKLRIHEVVGTVTTGLVLANVRAVDLDNIDINGYKGDRITTFNVQGQGLRGAENLAVAPANVPATLPTIRP